MSGGALLMYSYTAGTLGSIIVFQGIMSRRIHEIEKQRVTAILEKDYAQEVAVNEKQAKEQKAQFLSMLSHELKTPLSVIQMGLNQKTLSDKSRNYLYQAVKDMSMVIERCSVLEKVDDQIATHCSGFDIQTLLIQQIEQSNEPSRVHFIPVEVELGIFCDEDWLRIIFANLIDNALKYSPKDSQVQIDLEDESGRICVRIINDTSEELPETSEIFEKYFRAKSARKQTGAGLGLYIVKRLADQLNAQIFYRPVKHSDSSAHHSQVEMRLCVPKNEP